MQALVEMGFQPDQAKDALARSHGNVEAAANFLLTAGDAASAEDRAAAERPARVGERGT